MKASAPSFYRLFQRSRHYKAPAEDDSSPEAEAARQERERFAASAVTFCLKHDPDFRQYFWEKVCRVPDDPAYIPLINDDGVGVEPPRWADLSLVSDADGMLIVWVVEVKAGAKLEPIQNPGHKLFGKSREGYGWLFANDERDSKIKRRYIVFGQEEPLGLPAKADRLGISIQQRRWSDIGECPPTKLVTDLFHCLGSLGIQPFAMNKAKSIAVVKGLSGAGAAQSVLWGVYESLGIKAMQRKFEVYLDEESGGSVTGIYSRQPPVKNASKPHLHLQKLTGSHELQAWVGYFATADDKITRAVQFYCEEAAKRDGLLQKVRAEFPLARPEPEDSWRCVVVESIAGDGVNDLDWFTSVIGAAGVGGIA